MRCITAYLFYEYLPVRNSMMRNPTSKEIKTISNFLKIIDILLRILTFPNIAADSAVDSGNILPSVFYFNSRMVCKISAQYLHLFTLHSCTHTLKRWIRKKLHHYRKIYH